jgi:hypothetical protein
MARIRIAWGGGAITAELRDTPTVKALLAALPCQASASSWGEEVYFVGEPRQLQSIKDGAELRVEIIP